MWVKQYIPAENTSQIQARFNEITQKKRIILYYPSFIKFKLRQERIEKRHYSNIDEKLFQIEEKCKFSDWKKTSQVPITRHCALKL